MKEKIKGKKGKWYTENNNKIKKTKRKNDTMKIKKAKTGMISRKLKRQKGNDTKRIKNAKRNDIKKINKRQKGIISRKLIKWQKREWYQEN